VRMMRLHFRVFLIFNLIEAALGRGLHYILEIMNWFVRNLGELHLCFFDRSSLYFNLFLLVLLILTLVVCRLELLSLFILRNSRISMESLLLLITVMMRISLLITLRVI